jgi:L-Ala-D/L-Glu epimerase
MKLTFEPLELRTRHAFNIARETGAAGPAYDVWVRVHDGEGNEGWGEAPATPYYGETADTVAAILPRLGEALEAAAEGDPSRWSASRRRSATAVGRNPAAKVAISAALHDLVGKRLKIPVWKLWGLDPATAPVSSFTIGIDRLEVMREKVREAAAYPILKIKVGTARR